MTGSTEVASALAALKRAIELAPRQQVELLAAVDAVWAALDEAPEDLEPGLALEAQVVARHAESVLTRYFGM